MSNISGLLGTAGGFKGTGVDAPSNWVDDGKLDQANVNLQNNFGNQQSLLAQLQAQNGLGNQSSVYNQMQGVANGTGPNPAQAQLAQATQANTANQAALMAGQRGSSQNSGLIARQAAMQGANNQQQAAGQAATLQAQQSLGALGQMGGMANAQAANQIGQTNTNQQAAQQNLNSLLTGNSNQNAIKQGLITATAQQQASGMGSGMNAAGSSMASFGGGGGGGGAAAGAKGGRISEMPKMAMGGGLMKLFAMADGGSVNGSAYQGQSAFGSFLNRDVDRVDPGPNPTWGDDQLKNSGKFSKPKNQSGMTDTQAGNLNSADMQPPEQAGDLAPNTGDTVDMGGGAAMAKGGKIPVLLSPGEKKLTPEQAKAAAAGKIDPIKAGKTVAPGVKPKVSGAKNDYANDTVKSEEEPGTLILPRSVTQSKNPHWAAMRFVHAHMMANGGRVGIAAKPKGKKK